MVRKRQTIDVTLRNAKHGTEHVLHTRWYKPLTKHQLKTLRHKLCPDGCCLSNGTVAGLVGFSGPQDVQVYYGFTMDGRAVLTIEPLRTRPPAVVVEVAVEVSAEVAAPPVSEETVAAPDVTG